MSNTIESTKLQDPELLFFHSLKNEMHLFTSKKIIRVVKVVLISIMKSLPTAQVNEIIKKLPSTLQLIFVGCWKADDHYEPVVHLDELVENVCKEADAEKKALFTNEVDALKSILIVIKNLKIVFDNIGVNALPYSLITEYQQAVQEEAV